jgi:hypothetical protein
VKQKLHINNVGKIILPHTMFNVESQDHVDIYAAYDGMESVKFSLTIPGIQALNKELMDMLRAFEALRHPE